MELLIFLALLTLGFVVGTLLERRHYASIERREAELMHQVSLPVEYSGDQAMEHLGLASGSVVVSVDYFKRFLASLRNLFGGRVTAYETLIDRARREAVLRMKAAYPQAELFANVRIETAAIGTLYRNSGTACLEVCAYGSALRRRP
jgi:uncharacterized protein YbjQ (UPF0145 family)